MTPRDLPLRALLPDLSPWRASVDFRKLWLSGLITNFGSFLTFVALPVQMKELTGSAAAVGAIGAVELVPLIVFGLYGGALADAADKRKLILWTEAGQGVLCAVLLVNAVLPDPLIWPLYVVAALTSALGSVQRPALDSLMPRVVAHEQLPAAAALNSLRWTVGGVAGPALAGVVVAYAGLGWAYAVDLVTFAVSLLFVVGLAPPPPPTRPRSRRCGPSRRAPGTRGTARSSSGRTPSTSPRCSSRCRSPCCRSSPTSWTPSGRSV